MSGVTPKKSSLTLRMTLFVGETIDQIDVCSGAQGDVTGCISSLIASNHCSLWVYVLHQYCTGMWVGLGITQLLSPGYKICYDHDVMREQ